MTRTPGKICGTQRVEYKIVVEKVTIGKAIENSYIYTLE
jgi:hypothetical protein